MKILLTVPMNRTHDEVEAMNDNGLGYIAASCKEAGIEVTIFSWDKNMDLDTFRRKLIDINPDIVGLKVFTCHFRSAYYTLNLIRETLPDTITIIGGPHPSTSRPEDLFYEFDGIIDYAIAGDGELSVVSLIEKIRSVGRKPDSEDLRDIPGLIYKDRNEVKFNKPNFEVDLNKLPSEDWSLELTNYRPGRKVLISDSRGCPARCGHCMSWGINGSKPRKRSINLLCEEIKELVHKYNVRYIDFTGNAFFSDVDYLEEFCHRLIELNAPLLWNCTGAAYDRNLCNPKLLDLMKNSGCNAIHFGIETGNKEVSKRICKPLSLEEYKEIVNLTAKSGIHALGYFMFGFPDETVEEMEDTIRYAVSLPFYSISFQICIPYPGTTSYKAVLNQQGIEKIDWSNYDFTHPKLLPCEASLSQLKIKLFEAKLLAKSKILRRIYHYIFAK